MLFRQEMLHILYFASAPDKKGTHNANPSQAAPAVFYYVLNQKENKYMDKYNVIKAVLSGAVAAISAKLGILGPMLLALTGVMIVDYITGMLASKKENNISSRVGMWGIVKKLLYIVVVGVGMLMDWLILTTAESMGVHIPLATFFGLLVAVWLIINELISILENLTRMEIPMPGFLLTIIKHFKVAVERKGDELADIDKDSEGE